MLAFTLDELRTLRAQIMYSDGVLRARELPDYALVKKIDAMIKELDIYAMVAASKPGSREASRAALAAPYNGPEPITDEQELERKKLY